MGEFGAILISWYHKNKRTLPWRETSDPYKIWLSEIILQQTRVDQGLQYYLNFVEQYPNVFSLAEAPADEVLKLWQGLGYYNRANNLMTAAKTIAYEYAGHFPTTPSELIKIKGIGKYTSAAIASFAFNQAVPVVDGNVYRVLSRIFGIHTPINTAKAYSEFEELAKSLMDKHSPADFNQAIMEFGAVYCTPKKTDCENCIFSHMCYAKKQHAVGLLPVKKSKLAVKNRYIYYFIFESGTSEPQILIKKRTEKDIWKNLYDFPSFDSDKPMEPLSIWQKDPEFSKLFNGNFHIEHQSDIYYHQLTHRKIHATFFHVIVDKFDIQQQKKSLLLIPKKDIINYPVPRLIEKYFQDRNFL